MVAYEQLTAGDFYRDVNGALLAMVRLPRGGTLVDMGCGTGYFSDAISRDHPVGKIVAIDPDPDMVTAARQTLAGRGAVFEGSDRDLLRIAGHGAADLVILGNCIHLVPDVGELVAAAFAVLRPGGMILFNSTFVDDGADEAEKQFYMELLLKARRYLREIDAVQDAASPRSLAKRAVNAAKYAELLRATGFTAVTVQERWYQVPLEWIRKLMLTPVFASGALPGVPEQTAIDALSWAVDTIAARRSDALALRRKWVFVSAQKPKGGET